MMIDWDNDDVNLLTWRAATAETNFEKTALLQQLFRARIL
jgi:ketol-acid reductoisomerase